MQIQGNVFIITGGASGLGAASAQMLAAAGAKVVLADVQVEAGEKLAAALQGRFVKCDVTSEADGLAVVAAATELGTLRGLINCAGVAPAIKTVGKDGPHPLEAFARAVNINLIGTFNMSRLAADAMGKTEAVSGERGVIINTASVAAYDGQIGQAAYAASKAGVVGLTLPDGGAGGFAPRMRMLLLRARREVGNEFVGLRSGAEHLAVARVHDERLGGLRAAVDADDECAHGKELCGLLVKVGGPKRWPAGLPHPGPLPLGEGETDSALDLTGRVDRAFDDRSASLSRRERAGVRGKVWNDSTGIHWPRVSVDCRTDGVLRHEPLLAGAQVAQADLRGAVRGAFDAGGERRAEFLRALELLVRLLRQQRILDGAAGFAQLLHQAQRVGTQRFVLNQAEHIDAGVELGQQPARLEQFEQHHVAHAEAERGQVHLSAADELDEIVVASAAGDGAELALAVERLEDDAGVVGEAADDVVVHLHEVTETARPEVVEHGLQLRRRLARGDERLHIVEREAELGELLAAHLGRLTLQLVDGLVERVGVGGVVSAFPLSAFRFS